MQPRPERRASPARRVFYDRDQLSTSPDYRLGAAFERTSPGTDLVDEDEPTLVHWALPVLGAIVVGFFVGRWWTGRAAAKTIEANSAHSSAGKAQVGADSERCGFDELGCD